MIYKVAFVFIKILVYFLFVQLGGFFDMKDFLQEIKDRKVRKYLAIYFSSFLTVIGLTNLLSLRYQFPRYIFDSLIIIIIFGFLSVSVVAWFHGKEGRQKIKKKRSSN